MRPAENSGTVTVVISQFHVFILTLSVAEWGKILYLLLLTFASFSAAKSFCRERKKGARAEARTLSANFAPFTAEEYSA
jgi:hypothetical protein